MDELIEFHRMQSRDAEKTLNESKNYVDEILKGVDEKKREESMQSLMELKKRLPKLSRALDFSMRVPGTEYEATVFSKTKTQKILMEMHDYERRLGNIKHDILSYVDQIGRIRDRMMGTLKNIGDNETTMILQDYNEALKDTITKMTSKVNLLEAEKDHLSTTLEECKEHIISLDTELVRTLKREEISGKKFKHHIETMKLKKDEFHRNLINQFNHKMFITKDDYDSVLEDCEGIRFQKADLSSSKWDGNANEIISQTRKKIFSTVQFESTVLRLEDRQLTHDMREKHEIATDTDISAWITFQHGTTRKGTSEKRKKLPDSGAENFQKAVSAAITINLAKEALVSKWKDDLTLDLEKYEIERRRSLSSVHTESSQNLLKKFSSMKQVLGNLESSIDQKLEELTSMEPISHDSNGDEKDNCEVISTRRVENSGANDCEQSIQTDPWIGSKPEPITFHVGVNADFDRESGEIINLISRDEELFIAVQQYVLRKQSDIGKNHQEVSLSTLSVDDHSNNASLMDVPVHSKPEIRFPIIHHPHQTIQNVNERIMRKPDLPKKQNKPTPFLATSMQEKVEKKQKKIQNMMHMVRNTYHENDNMYKKKVKFRMKYANQFSNLYTKSKDVNPRKDQNAKKRKFKPNFKPSMDNQNGNYISADVLIRASLQAGKNLG